MPSFKEFSAWVEIDGKICREYGIEVAEDRTTRRSPRKHGDYQKMVTCYIASEAGKKFAVYWRNTGYGHAAMGELTLDGTECGGIVIYARRGTLPETVCNDGISDGAKLSPFIFSDLELTDDDTFLESDVPEELGVIELRIHPVRVTERPETSGSTEDLAPTGESAADSDSESSDSAKSPAPLTTITIHEKSKKAGNQQIIVGTPERLTTPEFFLPIKQTGPNLVTFRFIYRSLPVLQAKGIAPAPRPLRNKGNSKRKAAVDPERTPTPDAEMVKASKEARILREKLASVEATMAKTVEQARIFREQLAASEAKLAKMEKRPCIKREPTDSVRLPAPEDTQPGKRMRPDKGGPSRSI